MEIMNKIITQLYTVFSIYHVEGILRDRSCECCVSNEEIRLLLSKPLPELSENEIIRFMHSAGSTFGNVIDYKHFLPRILEIMTLPKNSLLPDFIDFEKLNYLEWETWPYEEQEAIHKYFMLLWKMTLTNNHISQIEDVLAILSKYGSLTFALETWAQSMTHESIVYLTDCYLNPCYSTLFTDHYDEAIKWISSDAVLERISTAFFNEKDPDIANRISITYTLIEQYKL